jgi:hypothetical protein
MFAEKNLNLNNGQINKIDFSSMIKRNNSSTNTTTGKRRKGINIEKIKDLMSKINYPAIFHFSFQTDFQKDFKTNNYDSFE